ncbi:zinc finger protein 267 isoform X2 [Cephus cinctus]|uniref:Zinc finger protein 267 isoform X2 n=1 Tax=Cephus cinctus TaxID=211228 RepID=A0AAJ7BFI9_CEPCN|nr:zinc finger protein 267 isoform X2 [Cephus cinctus]
MLKLILQTQEGQQVEVSIHPEDTFADLKKQYEGPENSVLPEFLKHLITNGDEVSEDTKILDHVTNSTTLEWAMEDSMEDMDDLDSIDPVQNIMVEAQIKECCANECISTELTAPDKTYFPLPSDETSDHFQQHHFLKGTNQVLKRRACPSITPGCNTEAVLNSSLLKPQPMYVKTEVKDCILLPTEENETLNDSESNSDMVQTTNVLIEPEHPGILCRLCGQTTEDPIYFYAEEDKQTEYSIEDKINLCLPITVNAKDPLPKQLCHQCHEKLNTCHDLALTCLETEDILKSMLQTKQFHVDETKHCPLCIQGEMQIIKKSGIYRKDKFEKNPNILSIPNTKVQQAVPSQNCVIEENEVDDVTEKMENDESESLVEHFEDEDISASPLSVPDTEFSCSICNKTINFYNVIYHADQHSGHQCVICKNVKFKTANELRVHFLKHGHSRFECEYCAISEDVIEMAVEHVKSCKPEAWDIQCDRCGEKFTEDEETHTCCVPEDEDWFECEQCEKKFRRKSNLTMHIKSHEKKETMMYKCVFCNKQFSRKGRLHTHLSIVHQDIDAIVRFKCYKCKKCNEAFSSSANADAHITEKHFSQLILSDVNYINDQFTVEELNLTKLYICEYCERCFTIPISLHEHRQNEHSQNSDYHCNVCNNSYESHKQLLSHKSLHSKSNEFEDLGIRQYYVCKYCNKTFLHYASLNAHTIQHRQPTPYLCRPCNLKFATYKEMETHRQATHPYQSILHEGPNGSYQCHYCKKKFSHELGLIKHIRMHTGERPYKCAVCGKAFSQSSGLYTHLKVHSNLRPYTCSQCPQTFKIKGDRDNHVKKHSGNRPYKCDFCQKAFMTQHVYSQHRKIHTNERPYKCDTCGDAFRRSHVLTVHMRRHTGEKPHACDLCPKAYRQRGDLLKHKKMQHGTSSSSVLNSNITNNSNSALKKASTLLTTDATTVLLPI